MRILVTGGGGMVGRNLCAYADFREHDILAPPRAELDLLDLSAAEEYMRANEPDMVIHAAGRVGGIEANRRDNSTFLLENLELGVHVLKAADTVGVQRVLNPASSCMYPKDLEGTLSEERLFTGVLEPTNEGYALAKLSVMKLGEFYSAERSREYKTVIPPNLYGPWDKFDPRRAHLVPAAIRKIDEARRSGADTVEIWGDGTARREFMFIGDLCSFVVHAIARFDSLPAVMNVGVGMDHTVLEYYSAIADVVGYEGGFHFDLDRPTGVRQKLLDSSRAITWGWRPEYGLSQGLKETYEFYLEHVSV